MTSRRLDTYRSVDLLAMDVPTCPDCGDLAHPCETVCASCGTHLYVRNTTARPGDQLDAANPAGQKETIMPSVHGCTCGGNDCCTACVLASYEPLLADPFVESADRALRLLTSVPSNVVEMKTHSYSKKVPS